MNAKKEAEILFSAFLVYLWFLISPSTLVLHKKSRLTNDTLSGQMWSINYYFPLTSQDWEDSRAMKTSNMFPVFWKMKTN